VAEFQRLIPRDRQDFATLEGFIAGCFVLEILKRMGHEVSRAASRTKFLDLVYTNEAFDIGGIAIGPFRDWPCNSEETCELNRCNMGLREVNVVSIRQEGEQVMFPIVKQSAFNTCGIVYEPGDCALPTPKSYLTAVIAAVGSVLGVLVILCVLFVVWWSQYVKRLHARGQVHVSLRDISLASLVRNSVYHAQEPKDVFDP
jgi:hypothetical protein